MNKNEIQNLIKELIQKTNITVSSISLEEKDSKNIWYSVEVDNPYFFTTRGGEALSALNHLVRRIIENKIPPETEKSFDFIIDINDFQKKRIENIHTIAHMMAERARYFKSSIEVDPMSAFDRRIVHEFLSNASDLKTESTGEGHSRRVVIKYIGNI
jgi:spoIIIJ-associated protein